MWGRTQRQGVKCGSKRWSWGREGKDGIAVKRGRGEASQGLPSTWTCFLLKNSALSLVFHIWFPWKNTFCDRLKSACTRHCFPDFLMFPKVELKSASCISIYIMKHFIVLWLLHLYSSVDFVIDVRLSLKCWIKSGTYEDDLSICFY